VVEQCPHVIGLDAVVEGAGGDLFDEAAEIL
jgi:hypothetical protein